MSRRSGSPIAATIFWLIVIVLWPLLVAGYVLTVVKLLVYSRRTGASATVLASFNTRWMQHMLGTRRDEPVARLAKMLPNISRLGWRLFLGPILFANRLTGYVPRLYRYPYPGEPPFLDQPAARTTFYDEALARHLPEINQLVILGAGLDTRCYRLPADTTVRCFEVDSPRTQRFKRQMLQKAGVDDSGVTYVPADFELEDWFEKLVAAGFDPTKPSFFLWESVTMYLDLEAVESTLRKIAGTAPGSGVAFDYFSAEILSDQSPFWRYVRVVLRVLGEPFKFGLDNTPPVRRRVEEFLASCGLTLAEQHNFGQETGRKHALAGFATAFVPLAPT
jgi:methyltransferase (TIGR00027 family)